MECIKCGREIAGNQAFCNECLQQMAKHPVSPGTPVHIPLRPAPPDKPTSRKRERTPTQTITQLRKIIRWLTITITILSLLLCATAAFLLHTLDAQERNDSIGRNYTVDTSVGQ